MSDDMHSIIPSTDKGGGADTSDAGSRRTFWSCLWSTTKFGQFRVVSVTHPMAGQHPGGSVSVSAHPGDDRIKICAEMNIIIEHREQG